MKAAFFFDTYLLRDNSNYYGMTLTYDFFHRRYLNVFDNIIVSTRVKDIIYEIGDYSGYKKTNGKKVQVVPIEKYKNIPDIIFKKRKIKKEIESIIDKVDKVIIRLPSIIGLCALDIVIKKKKNYIVEMVACPWDGYNNHTNIVGKLVAPFMYFKTKNKLKNASKVLYVTDKFLQKRYPTKGISYSCSDVELYENSKNVLESRIKNINTKKDVISLMTIGNVNMKYKGHEYVIKAISLLKKEGLKYKYYLIGNGNFDRLKKMSVKYGVKDDVVFLGSLNHDEVFEKLKNIDIYIQPSLQEGLPRALLEAMNMGCPCIGSDVGGIPELLSKKVIFKRKKYKELAYLIKNFNSKKMLSEAKKNYNKSLRYSKENLEEKRIKIYKNI